MNPPPKAADSNWFITNYAIDFFHSLLSDYDYIIDRMWPSTVVYESLSQEERILVAKYMEPCFPIDKSFYLKITEKDLIRRMGNKNLSSMLCNMRGPRLTVNELIERYNSVLDGRDGWITIDATLSVDEIVSIIIKEIT